MKRRIPIWNLGLTKETHIGIRRQSEKLTGRTKESYEGVKRTAEKLKGIKRPDQSERMKKNNPMHNLEVSENQSYYMLTGGAVHARSFNTRISKAQRKLFDLVRSWFPQARIEFPVKEANRNIDIAIPEFMIAIEYNEPYWHQDKEKDIKRQKQLEDIGWKFLNYYPLPTEEEFIQNVRKLL